MNNNLIQVGYDTETNTPIFETIAVARAKVTGNTAVGYKAREIHTARETVVHSTSTR